MPDSDAVHVALQSPLWEINALLVGLVVGSFANVCIHRLPLGLSVARPRSRCPRCQAPIGALDNVPVLSYVLLRGRCRACRAPISPRYPAVELANGLSYLAVAARWGPTPVAVVYMVFISALLVLALIDFDHQILPDVITLPGTAFAIVASGALWWFDWPGLPHPLESIASAAGGYLAFFAVAESYRRTRHVEGLGQGDWKMAAMLGAVLGWQKLLLTVLLAALAGTAVGVALMASRRQTAQHPLPLGTFLGIAGIAVVFAGDALLAWYRGVFSL
jgi:leader peptidase (prepilin peptidase) / N-methyltransferase